MNPLMLSHRLCFPNGFLELATQTMLDKVNDYLTAVKRLDPFGVQAKEIANCIGVLVDGGLMQKTALVGQMDNDLTITKSNVANYLADALNSIRDDLSFDLTTVDFDWQSRVISLDTHPQVYLASDEQTDPKILALRQSFISLFDGVYCVSDEAILSNGIRGDIFDGIKHLMNEPDFKSMDALALINESVISNEPLEGLSDEQLDEVKAFAIHEFILPFDADESSLEEIADALVEKVKQLSKAKEGIAPDWTVLKAVEYGDYQEKANRVFSAVDFYLANQDEIKRIDQSLEYPYDHDSQFFFYGAYLVSDELIELAEADVNYIYETGEACSAIFKLHADSIPDAKLFMQGYDLFIRAV